MGRKFKINAFQGHYFYEGLIGENSVIIDLGACLGEFSSKMSETFRCKAYAVEASPFLFQQIKESNSVRKFNYAITDRNGPKQLSISEDMRRNTIIPRKPYNINI